MLLTGNRFTDPDQQKALERGTHKSTMAHIPFLREEFSSTVGKRQWVVLPYSVIKDMPGILIIPPRVNEDQDQPTRWINNYIYSSINSKYFSISDLSSM